MTFKIASCLLGIYTNTSCLGQAGSKLSGRVRAACTAAWDFSQRACQLLMNSHSVLSSSPPPSGALVLQFVKISQCVWRGNKVQWRYKGPVCQQKSAGWSHFLHHSVSGIIFFRASVSLKIKATLDSPPGRASNLGKCPLSFISHGALWESGCIGGQKCWVEWLVWRFSSIPRVVFLGQWEQGLFTLGNSSEKTLTL